MYQSETRIACGGDVYSQNQDIHIILWNFLMFPSYMYSQTCLMWSPLLSSCLY
jgi:hypothetical protein